MQCVWRTHTKQNAEDLRPNLLRRGDPPSQTKGILDPSRAPVLLVGDSANQLGARLDRTLAHDVGTLTIQPADLFVAPGATLQPCELVFTFVRGGGTVTYDPALGPAGLIAVTQERVVRVATTP